MSDTIFKIADFRKLRGNVVKLILPETDIAFKLYCHFMCLC